MITNEIEFQAPTTVSEALDLLAERGDDITVLSGGMSLLPMMNLGIVQADIVMSLNHIDELTEIVDEGDRLVIGAGVRHAKVVTDPTIQRFCPALPTAARSVGDVQVRNRGTIGGSVAHADPSADYLPVLASVGASITLRSAHGERTLTTDEFFIDVMFTSREPSELVTAITIPKLSPGAGMGYKRLARVEGSFAIVNAAAMVSSDMSEATVALGGVGPGPVVVDASAHVGNGAGLSDSALAGVGDAAYEAAEGATGDAMSDAEYRREMARVFARRALEEAVGARGPGADQA